jgi:hypothetical protein
VPDDHPTQQLPDAVRALDDAIALTRVRPEDADTRMRLIRPVEQLVSELPACPTDASTPATRIARLLWFKRHPDKTDADSVLQDIVHDDPLVRITAAETMASALERCPEPWSDRTLSRRARSALEEQRREETSPVVAYHLDQLLKDVAKLSRVRSAATRPWQVNPYTAGTVIDRGDRFYGRRETLQQIRQEFGEAGKVKSIVLYGARRSGKTSLLYRLKDGELGADAIGIYIDLQSLAGEALSGFLQAIANAIEATLQSRGTPAPADAGPPAEMGLAAFQRYVTAALERVAPARLVLLFDEYEVLKDFIANVDVARQFQSLLERHPRFFLVFAGAQKVESLKERNFMLLLDNCRYMKITYLKPAEARQLIVEPPRGVLTFPDDVVDEILELGGGHPFYTQILCHTVFELAQADRRVTSQHVEQAVLRFLENPAPHLILGWNGLQLEQKVVAASLSDIQRSHHHWVEPADVVAHLRKINYPIRLQAGEIQQALGSLRELEWVEKQEGVRAFRLTLGLVRCWIREHRSVWEVLQEYNASVVNRVARLGRRAAAAAVDAVLLLAALIGLGQVVPLTGLPVVVLAYYVVVVAAFNATPGMFVARIRVRGASGLRLGLGRGILCGALISVPFVLITAAAPALAHGTEPLWALGLIGLAVVMMIVHGARVHFSRSGRGVFDGLLGVVFVAATRGLP